MIKKMKLIENIIKLGNVNCTTSDYLGLNNIYLYSIFVFIFCFCMVAGDC